MNLQIFLPIKKVDAANHLVYGTFTEEAGDRSDEIMDYDSSKPNFEKWSEGLYGASGGKNYGNVRAMHKAVAAGHFVNPISYNDDGKAMEAVAWITDDDEWKKVEAGTYTGFSVGGRYVKRWTDPENPRLIRYTADPHEVSLVDLPCVKGATFQLIKGEGVEPEDREFTSIGDPIEPKPLLSDPPNANPAVREEQNRDGLTDKVEKTQAPEPSSASLDSRSSDPRKGANSSESLDLEGSGSVPELEQVWKAKDGTTFNKKADAVKHNEQLAANVAVEGVTNPLKTALGKLGDLFKTEGEEKTDEEKKPGAAAAVDGAAVEGSKVDKLRKDLYDVGRIASIVSELRWIRRDILLEQAIEGDTGSTLPTDVQKACDALCQFLLNMVQEEVSEIMSDTDVQLDDGVTVLVAMAKAVSEMPLPMREALKSAEVNEDFCKILTDAAWRQPAIELQKTSTSGDSELKELEKITEADLTLDNAQLPPAIRALVRKNAGLEDEFGKICSTIEGLTAKVEKISQMPEPPKGVLRAITKAQDTGFAGSGQLPEGAADVVTAYQAHLAKMSPEQRAMEMLKLSLANPTYHVD